MNEQTVPVQVTVSNFPEVKRNRVTTVKTFIIDSAGTNGPSKAQISGYEPNRCRLVIMNPDTDIIVTLEVPVTSPDVSSKTQAPQGLHLTSSLGRQGYEFFGPDAMWVNSVTDGTTGEGSGRICVVKEYL